MNIAVIGCGYWGKNLVRNFKELCVLNCVCDIDKETIKGIEKLYPDIGVSSCKDIFANDEINAVAIATPASTHYALVKEALEKNKDVFVEKPLALNLDEAEELVKLAKEKGKIIMVDHILRYHPAIIKLKELIDNNILGDLQYIYSTRLNLGKLRKEENVLWSFAPHDISVILYITGKVPKSVDVFGEAYLQEGIFDTTLTQMTFEDRLKAHIFVSWLHPFKEQKLVVVGSHNMAVFDDQDNIKLKLYPYKISNCGGKVNLEKAQFEPVKIKDNEPLKASCQHFIDCVNNRKKPHTDGQEAVRVLKVIKKGEASLK